MRQLAVMGLAMALATPGGAAGAQDMSAAAGQRLFAAHCAACHGADARGQGVEAAGLPTAPPDLTRIAARRDGVWPMLEIMSILDGYAARVAPRAGMPVIPDLTEGGEVDFDTGNGQTLRVPARLIALATWLEGIQSPRPDRYVP